MQSRRPKRFGQVAYAAFIRTQVAGLEPPERLRDADISKMSFGQIVRALPKGYGSGLGRKAWALALQKTKDRSKAEDILATVAEKILDDRVQLRPRTPLRAAEGYILRSVSNAAIDLARAESRRREQSLTRPDDDGPDIDITDPQSLAVLESVPTVLLRRVFQEIGRVHPRAQDYLESALEGRTKAEIARQWDVSPVYVSKWLRTYGPQMERAVEHHVRSAAASGRASVAERVAVRFLAVAHFKSMWSRFSPQKQRQAAATPAQS